MSDTFTVIPKPVIPFVQDALTVLILFLCKTVLTKVAKYTQSVDETWKMFWELEVYYN